MKKLIVVLLTGFLLQLFCNDSKAQVPQAFKYQAVVRNAQGDIIADKAVVMQISILQDSNNGNVVYREIHNITTSAQGAVNVEIGNGTVKEGLFQSIDWNKGVFFLKTEIDINAGSNYTFLGTTQLLSVPYSFYSIKAGTTEVTGPVAGANKQLIFNDNSLPAGTKNIVYDKTTGSIAIGTEHPNASAKLEINSTNSGLLPPCMTEQQRNAIVNPANGLQIFNTTSGCLNFFKDVAWYEICGTNTMSVPVASSNSPLCLNDVLNLYAVTINGANYLWSGPNNFTSVVQNPIINNVTMANAGTYTVKAMIGNSSSISSTNVLIKPILNTNINIIADTTFICTDDPINFVASVTNGGSSPKYQWKKNGVNINDATSSIFIAKSILADKDVITCALTSSEQCANPNPAVSNSIIVYTATQPTIANAGQDQMAVVGDNTILEANTPVLGTGLWSVISGTGGLISEPANPLSTFVGIEGSTYTLKWTITLGCSYTYDEVIISFTGGSGFLMVTPNASANDLISNLVGNSIAVSNIKMTGSSSSFGIFKNNNSIEGLESGIILSTGNVIDFVGPNDKSNKSGQLKLPGDNDINTIANCQGCTKDAAVLEFDFIPSSTPIGLNYVFASEEYPEYVCSNFNDIFALILTGPKPTGGNYINTNIALIPGTSTPVAINSINSGNPGKDPLSGKPYTSDGCISLAYSNYYVNNGTGATPNDNKYIQYDGYTKILTASAEVVPLQSYHFKIVIADNYDDKYDSAILLKKNSFGQ